MSGQYIYSNKYGFTNGLTTEETTENGQIAHTNGTVVGREGVEPSTNGLRVIWLLPLNQNISINLILHFY